MSAIDQLRENHVSWSMNLDSVNRISNDNASVSERRICLRSRLRVIPPKAASCMNLFKLWQFTNVEISAEIIDDEALHVCDLDGVDQGHLMHHAGWAHDTNSSVLARQCFDQLVSCVLDFDHRKPGREGCRRMNSTDHSHVRTGADEDRCDECSKVARGRYDS